MSETAIADDKKEKPDVNKKESYTEKMTVRTKRGEKFVNPIKDVPAFYWEIKGKKVVYLMTTGTSVEATKGSEMTDQKTGDVWTVTEPKPGSGNFRFVLCYVEKKEPEKKPKD